MSKTVIKVAPETPADPNRLRSVGVTGSERRSTRKRQRPAERPDMLDVLEIRQRARHQFPTNDTIKAVRAAALLAAQDKAQRVRGGEGVPPKLLTKRWSSFYISTGTHLTAGQRRSLRRRSTKAELAALEPHQRLMIGMPW